MPQPNKKRDADYDVNYMDRYVQAIIEDRERGRGMPDDIEGFETDAAFIADWTRWAAEREIFRKPWTASKITVTAKAITPEEFAEYIAHLGRVTFIAGDVHVLPDKDTE